VSGRRDDPVMVYSTERGLVCPKCRVPVAKCRCGERGIGAPGRRDRPGPPGDEGAWGKTVTAVSGVPLGGRRSGTLRRT